MSSTMRSVVSVTSVRICQLRANFKVPTEFIVSTLGPYAKYSSCLYPTGKETIEQAEILMLESYCEKAQLKDGMDILDLGCGASCPNLPVCVC
jgi:cyclopropane fatty-acyl-phospholipid synthase-like methyltransferase